MAWPHCQIHLHCISKWHSGSPAYDQNVRCAGNGDVEKPALLLNLSKLFVMRCTIVNSRYRAGHTPCNDYDPSC
jgi:hypothetical protein